MSSCFSLKFKIRGGNSKKKDVKYLTFSSSFLQYSPPYLWDGGRILEMEAKNEFVIMVIHTSLNEELNVESGF